MAWIDRHAVNTNRDASGRRETVLTQLARVVVALVFIKPYYDFRVVSIYEFLRVRFGERTKNGASAVFLITRALASGTRLYVARWKPYSRLKWPRFTRRP